MHDGKLRLPVYWLTCVLMMVGVSLPATTIVLPTDEQLVEKSPLIVRGTVVSSTPIDREGAIWTETIVKVDHALKGSAPATLTIREIGGLLGDRITKIFGSPEYAVAERVLLFLTPTARGDYQTTDLYIGKFAEASTGQRRIWVQAAEANVALLDAGLEPIVPRNFVREAHGFETFIAERAAGRRTPVKYEIEQSSGLQPRNNFTLIDEPTVYRWFTFDNGGTASWFSYGTQSGYSGGGVNEIRTAMASWTDYSAARINYSYGGQFNGSPAGLNRPNGTNEILFDDPLQEIAGTFSGSGVIGQGGFNGVSNSANWTAPFAADGAHASGTFRAWNITEGNLTIQDGVTPQRGMSSSRLAELLAHELGHTLGIGHSADSSALMYATLTGLGPSLRGDDQVAARWLYPSGNSSPPPPPTIQPPAAPTNLSGTSSGTSVSLQWSDNATNETGQTIYYASGNGSFVKAADVAASTRSVTLNGFAPGSYRFYVVAFNTAGVSGASNTINVTINSTAPPPSDPAPAGAYRSLVPVSAQTNGVGGSVWRTELTIFNSGSESTTVTLTFLPGAGGSPLNRSLFLAPRQSRTYANALMELYGIATGAGAISIEATSPTTTSRLKVSSRTFTDSSLGTYGQGVPDVQGDQLQRTLFIAGMMSNADYRTNIGLVNKSDASTAATLTLYDGDGNALGTNTVTLPAKNFQQGALAAYFPATSGRSYPVLSMRIASSASEAVGVYASIVDNRTQDPIYLQAVVAPVRESVTLPAVGRAPGANNTFWRSDVTFFNPTTERIFLTVRHKSAQGTLSLSSRQTRVIADILSQLGVDSGSGSLEVSWSGPGPVVTSRTYTTAPGGGTFGQSIDPIATFGPESYVTGLRSDVDFRSNVGFVNGGNSAINVDVTLLSAAGQAIASGSIQLAARAQAQYSISALFQGINVAGIGAFTLQARSNGNVFAYGSIVDNDSGDPVFFAGR